MLRSVVDALVRRYHYLVHGTGYVATRLTPDTLRRQGAKVGVDCRIYTINASSEPYLIEIGDHVTLCDGVSFVTHDGAVWVFREKEPDIELFGRITIGNNVFVGLNAIILYGTKIRDNSIVGAGSVVKGKFPANSVIAGIPASRLCSVDDYYQMHNQDYTQTRHLPPDAKRRAVLEHLDSRRPRLHQ
jgi:acetyltransferase-like isoleucine patch superfamily enzyme